MATEVADHSSRSLKRTFVLLLATAVFATFKMKMIGTPKFLTHPTEGLLAQHETSCQHFLSNPHGEPLHNASSRAELVKGISRSPIPHLFAFPDSYPRKSVLCVPQKNGNRQFSGLLYAAWMGRPPSNQSQVNEAMESLWDNSNLWQDSNRFDDSHTIYVVARNPYTRFLSFYLDFYETRGEKGLGGVPITSFGSFAVAALELTEGSGGGSVCVVNHHLCLQVESCVATTLAARAVNVIRLEDQSS